MNNTQSCGAMLLSGDGFCERVGRYDGRCWQHRKITAAEYQAILVKRTEPYLAAKDRERRARSAFKIARDELVADLIEGRETRPSRERVRQLRTLRDDWNSARNAARAMVPE